MERPDPTTLRFDNLDQYLLLKNGNYLYKVPFEGGRDGLAVLKVYYGSRSTLQYVYKTVGNICFACQTSVMPKARRRVELECLKLWREGGFRVFDTYEDVRVEGLPEGGYTLFEWCPGIRFVEYFTDPAVSFEQRMAMWRRFVPDWHRRHRLAVDQREPRLVHENGDLKHIIIREDELVYFDFEMAFRSRRRVKEFVAREILAFLKSLGKCVGDAEWDAFLEETVKLYPSKELLKYTHQFAFKNPNPALRAARALDRKFKPRARKPFGKYSAARRLGHLLGVASA